MVLTAPPIVAATASAYMGVADVVYWTSVPDEVHPHEQAHRQPLEGVETMTMGPLALVVLGYASLGYVRRARRSDRTRSATEPC
jgi:hypothetical protein